MLYFNCKTNTDTPYVNVVHIVTADGRKAVLDRDRTGYTYDEESGTMEMEWFCVYLWDGEAPDYNIPEGFFENAVIDSVEIEDDAPIGYFLRVLNCSVDGKPVRLAWK